MHARTFSIVVRFALITVGASALSACSIGGGPLPLESFALATPDAPLTETAWEDVRGNAGKQSFQGHLWLAPIWFSGEHVKAAKDGDSVSRTEFAFFDLGVLFLPFLPLWISADTRLDRQSGSRATQSFVWNPLYTSWESDGWPRDEASARAWGFPLLYSGVEFGVLGEPAQFDWRATLWTLGPSWATVDLDTEKEHVEGWVVMPLMLAGLGSLVWTSAELESTSSDVSAHGPLNGLLGYKSEVDRSAFESTRRIVGGVLWYDVEEYAVDDTVIDARHGPLWGMFGWGYSDGEPGLRVLWIPIDIG